MSATASASGKRPGTLAALVASTVALVGLVAVMLFQVEVSGAGVTRTCGSVIDTAVDRTGWEHWWDGDLAEPDSDVRAALVRTTRCPDAINRSAVFAAALASIVGGGAIFVHRRYRPEPRRGSEGPLVGRIARLGTATSMAGAALIAAGVVAIVVLVADGDSTLFLYIDRLVVAIVGLIVLIPAIALLVIGRVLVLTAGLVHRNAEDDRDG